MPPRLNIKAGNDRFDYIILRHVTRVCNFSHSARNFRIKTLLLDSSNKMYLLKCQRYSQLEVFLSIRLFTLISWSKFHMSFTSDCLGSNPEKANFI